MADLRYNFRIFPQGKCRGYFAIQLTKLDVSLSDWSDLPFSGDEGVREEALSLSRSVKETILRKLPLTKICYRLIMKLNACLKGKAKNMARSGRENGENNKGGTWVANFYRHFWEYPI